MGTKKILQDRDFLVHCRLSVCPNDTHLYIELNHEPKNLNPTGYQVVAHFYMGEGRGPLPNPHLCVMLLLNFVLLICYLYL